MDINEILNQYEKYIIEDSPIPYITSSMTLQRENLSSEIIKLSQKQQTINLSKEESEYLNQLQDEFKNQQLLIYPVTMHNYLDFNISANCLMINKNSIPDPKVISMSYLDFLFSIILDNTPEAQFYSYSFTKILELCLKVKPESIAYQKDDKGKIKLIINTENYNNLIIDRNDFDNIKEIICSQNINSYDNSYIDPELEKAMREVEEFENRHKKKIGSIEDQIICLMLALHEVDKKKILDLTIRTFSKLLQRYDFKLHYVMVKQASMSGMVEFKGEIDHWMSDLSQKDRFAGKITELDSFKNKIESANG